MFHIHSDFVIFKSESPSLVLLSLKLSIFPLHQCTSEFTMIKKHLDSLLQYSFLGSILIDDEFSASGRDWKRAAASGLWPTRAGALSQT